MNSKRVFAVVMVALLVFLTIGCAPQTAPASLAEKPTIPPAAPAKNLRVALIMEGVITDAGWNADAYNGLMEAKKQVANIDVAYSEGVKAPDWEATMRDYGKQGYDVILCHHSVMTDTAGRVAPEFPKSLYVVSNSGITGPNISGLDTKNEESGYMAGYIAGLLTKTKKVGYIVSIDALFARRANLGFKDGAKAACPDCEVKSTTVGSSDDLAGGKEAGFAMYDAGVDIIWQYADATGLGVIEAAKVRNQMVIGSGADQLDLAPDNLVTTTGQFLAPMILSVIKGVKEGTFVANQAHLYGYDTGLYDLGRINDKLVTKDQAAKIEQVRQDLKAGKIKIEHLMQ
ncbi:MAG: BMP family protein [Anaerolineaceae bacterium]|nr:BMP family protein [Anaerolineaceae bacterium]